MGHAKDMPQDWTNEMSQLYGPGDARLHVYEPSQNGFEAVLLEVANAAGGSDVMQQEPRHSRIWRGRAPATADSAVAEACATAESAGKFNGPVNFNRNEE